MLVLEQALQHILSAVQPLAHEIVPLGTCHGRVLAAPLSAPISLPPFDNSAMDGYAVRSADVAKASRDNPVELGCISQMAAGTKVAKRLLPGTCARIFTGAPLPPEADAVVMQEDTETSQQKNRIRVLDSVKPWENVRLRGEDIREGAALFRAGDRIDVTKTAVLAALGINRLKLGRRPRIGLLATGNELVEPGRSLKPGQIYESNRAVLSVLLTQAGALPIHLPLAPDNLVVTRLALKRGFAKCDAVITTGGVSVGELDFVKTAFEEIGGQLDFWRVAIRPGKPFAFGKWRGKLLFGLPGNPVSAFVTFLLLVRPAIMKWQGAADLDLPCLQATLLEPLENQGDRSHFVRVHVNAEGNARLAGIQASHILSSLAKANGLVEIPAKTVLRTGESVRVMYW
ncbi:MAG TPA: gephyrin-like molybdotransferase Glp [Verrucomicrobiae bacterium]